MFHARDVVVVSVVVVVLVTSVVVVGSVVVSTAVVALYVVAVAVVVVITTTAVYSSKFKLTGLKFTLSRVDAICCANRGNPHYYPEYSINILVKCCIASRTSCCFLML